MQSIWDSFNIVNTISIIFQWLVAVSGIIALIFTLRASTLKDKVDIAKSQKEISERLAMQKQLSSTQQDFKVAKEEAQSAKQEAADAKRKLMPRELSKNQVEILHSEFEKIYPIASDPSNQTYFVVAAKMMDGESLEYAKQILNAIKSTKLGSGTGFDPNHLNIFEGVSIFFNPSDTNSKVYEMTKEAFEKAGIKFTTESFKLETFNMAMRIPNTVYIVVGYK